MPARGLPAQSVQAASSRSETSGHRMLRNTKANYGWVAIGLHWLVAFGVIGLFALGLWMVELSYYDPWYRNAPNIHKGIGVLLFLVMLGRLVWRLVPAPAGG